MILFFISASCEACDNHNKLCEQYIFSHFDTTAPLEIQVTLQNPALLLLLQADTQPVFRTVLEANSKMGYTNSLLESTISSIEEEFKAPHER